MSESRPPSPTEEPENGAGHAANDDRTAPAGQPGPPADADAGGSGGIPTQPMLAVRPLGGLPGRGLDGVRLPPLLPRRQNPHLIVEVDGSTAAYGALVWALREAARREATVVAVGVLDEPDGDPFGSGARIAARAHAAAYERVEAHLLRAIAETGVQGRSRCAVLGRPVLEALTAAGRGADLVLVDAHGKALLRQAVPRQSTRRLARGA